MSEATSIMPNLADLPAKPINHDGKPKMPGAVIAICIIALILGLSGLVSSVFGIGSALLLSGIANGQNLSDPQAAQTAAFFEGMIMPKLVLGGLNFLVAPSLIVASIGALCSKRWGLPLLRWALILAAIFIVIKAGLTMYMQFEYLKFTSTALETISSGPARVGPSLPLAKMVQPVHYVQIIGTGIFLFALFNAYICGFLYLNSNQAKRYSKALR